MIENRYYLGLKKFGNKNNLRIVGKISQNRCRAAGAGEKVENRC